MDFAGSILTFSTLLANTVGVRQVASRHSGGGVVAMAVRDKCTFAICVLLGLQLEYSFANRVGEHVALCA